MIMKYYNLELCGLKRRLPLNYISKKTQLANFSVLGDVELVDALADYLANYLKNYNFDYIVACEIKIVPLAHGISKRLKKKRFVVCRKSIKPYMVNPVVLKPLPYFPKHVKALVIDGNDASLLAGKKVVIIESVISTGVTMRMMKKLMEKINAQVKLMVAVLKQGQPFDHFPNLYYLAEIPILTQK